MISMTYKTSGAPHATGRTADARQNCAGCDEHVADEPIAGNNSTAAVPPGRAVETPSGVDGSADQKNHGVGVDEGAERPYPLPGERASTRQVGVHHRHVDGAGDHARGGDCDHRHQSDRQAPRYPRSKQQPDRSLRQRRTPEESPDHVPELEHHRAPAEEREPALRKGPEPVDENASAPPEQVVTATPVQVAAIHHDGKHERDHGRGDR